MRKTNARKRCVVAVRVIPFVMATTLLAHLLLYAFGIELSLIGFISGTGLMSCVFMFFISKNFGMCLAHKVLIGYSLAVGLGMMLNRNGLLGRYEYHVLYTLIALGFIVILSATLRCLRRNRI